MKKQNSNSLKTEKALCCHIAGILYALFMAPALFLIVFIARWILRFDIFVLIILIGYLIAIVNILINFRFMRLKEVQTVFFATYKNRELFSQDVVHDAQSVSKQS